jgi:dihydropteroate synthase
LLGPITERAGQQPDASAPTTAAGAIALAVANGVRIVRATNVREARRAADVIAAVLQARAEP